MKYANPDAIIAWADSEAGKKAKQFNKDKLSTRKGESFLAILSNMAKLFDRTIDGMISCDNLHQNQELNIRFLLDTGALQANYISLVWQIN